MILVCIGASEFDFSRLLQIIDNLCDKNIIKKEDIIAQIGTSNYIPKNYKYFDLIPRDEFQNYLDKCDFLISHAGTGSVVPAIKKGKKVIVFPRLSKYNEHIDDHQLELADTFTNAGYTLCAQTEEELINCIKSIHSFNPKIFISSNNKINKLIVDFIENR